jgi:hypothetical protein
MRQTDAIEAMCGQQEHLLVAVQPYSADGISNQMNNRFQRAVANVDNKSFKSITIPAGLQLSLKKQKGRGILWHLHHGNQGDIAHNL